MVIKEASICVKISPEDKLTLENGASINQETLSGFMRRCSLKKAMQLIQLNEPMNNENKNSY